MQSALAAFFFFFFYYSAFSFSLDATLQIFKWVSTRLQTAWQSLKIATDIIAIPGTVMPAGSGVSRLSLKHTVKDVEKTGALVQRSARTSPAFRLKNRLQTPCHFFCKMNRFCVFAPIKESINWLCRLQRKAKDKLISFLPRSCWLLSKALPADFHHLKFQRSC